jgi:hypothetical protein
MNCGMDRKRRSCSEGSSSFNLLLISSSELGSRADLAISRLSRAKLVDEAFNVDDDQFVMSDDNDVFAVSVLPNEVM